jgi:hypothetical protein
MLGLAQGCQDKVKSNKLNTPSEQNEMLELLKTLLETPWSAVHEYDTAYYWCPSNANRPP